MRRGKATATDMAIKRVGVIGCGLMGSGIAQVSAQAGFPVTVVEASQELLDRGLSGLRKNLDALVAKARLQARRPGRRARPDPRGHEPGRAPGLRTW